MRSSVRESEHGFPSKFFWVLKSEIEDGVDSFDGPGGFELAERSRRRGVEGKGGEGKGKGEGRVSFDSIDGERG